MAVKEQQILPSILPEGHIRQALLEAVIYVADQPLNPEQISQGLGFPLDVIRDDLTNLEVTRCSPRRNITRWCVVL